MNCNKKSSKNMCNFARRILRGGIRERNRSRVRGKMQRTMNTITGEKLAELDRRISEASAVAVSTHAHPDGDAIGSSTALARYLMGRGKPVRIILPDPCPENLGFALDESLTRCIADKKDAAEAALKECDLLISIDYNSPQRTDALEGAVRRFGGFRTLIDHHISPDTDFYDLVFSECEVSSSCELLYNILLGMPDIGGKA